MDDRIVYDQSLRRPIKIYRVDAGHVESAIISADGSEKHFRRTKITKSDDGNKIYCVRNGIAYDITKYYRDAVYK